MSTKRIVKAITAVLCFTIFVYMLVACDNGRGMMNGNGASGMNHWHLTQILIGLGLGLVAGLLFCLIVGIRKK